MNFVFMLLLCVTDHESDMQHNFKKYFLLKYIYVRLFTFSFAYIANLCLDCSVSIAVKMRAAAYRKAYSIFNSAQRRKCA